MSEIRPDPSGAERFIGADGGVDWAAVEQAAFDGFPVEQRAVAEAADELDREPERFLVTRGLLLLLLEVAPVLGFGLGVIAVRWGVLEGVPGAVLAAAVTLVYIGYQVVLRRWVARDPREVDGRRVMFIWINSGLFLLPTAIVFGTAAVFSFGRSPEWVVFAFAAVVMIVAIAVALGTAARIQRAGRAMTVQQAASAVRNGTAYGRAGVRIEAMSEADRAAVRGRIDAAVQELTACGAIDRRIADDVRAVPLGGLARWAWLRERQDTMERERRGRRSSGRGSR